MSPDGRTTHAPPLGSTAILRQRWSEVTFLHWRVDPGLVEPHMPPGCSADVIDGSAWVGLIAFQMSRSSFFGGPRIPWLGDFPEVNVRLYSIDENGDRGVVFLSLEASHLVPVLVARAAFQPEVSVGGHEDRTARRPGRLPDEAPRSTESCVAYHCAPEFRFSGECRACGRSDHNVPDSTVGVPREPSRSHHLLPQPPRTLAASDGRACSS